MNIRNFTPTAWLLLGIVSFSSCVSTGVVHYPEQERRVIHSGPPGQMKKVYGDRSARDYAHGRNRNPVYQSTGFYPLIIIRTPDIIIRQAGDGRYYYLNRDGYYYWRGRDDRFYIDERYVANLRYDMDEYNRWNEYRRYNDRGHEYEREDRGRSRGHGNKKKHHHDD